MLNRSTTNQLLALRVIFNVSYKFQDDRHRLMISVRHKTREVQNHEPFWHLILNPLNKFLSYFRKRDQEKDFVQSIRAQHLKWEDHVQRQPQNMLERRCEIVEQIRTKKLHSRTKDLQRTLNCIRKIIFIKTNNFWRVIKFILIKRNEIKSNETIKKLFKI